MLFPGLSRHWLRAHKLAHFAGLPLLDQMIVSGLNFIIAIVLARILGLEAFGQYTLVLIIVFFCLEIQRALVTAPMIHIAAAHDVPGYIARLVRAQIFGAALMAVCAGVFVQVSGMLFPKWGIADLIGPTMAVIFFRMQMEFARRYFYLRDLKARVFAMDITVATSVVGILTFLNWLDFFSVQIVLWAHAAAYAVAIPFYAGLWCRIGSGLRMNIAEFLKRHGAFGGWLAAAVVVTYAASNILVMTGGAVLGATAAGTVKASQYMMGGMIVLFQAVENFVPVHMTRLHQKGNKGDFTRFVLKAGGGMMLFAAVHGMLIYAYMDPLARWLVPGNPDALPPLVMVNIVLAFVLVVGYMMQFIMRAHNRTRVIFAVNLATATLSALLGPGIIDHFGVIGVLYGLLGVHIMAQILYTGALFTRGRA